MKIRIIAVGKIKEPYLKEGINEYLLRLSSYAKVEIIEVNDSKVKDNPNESDILKVTNEEGERILSKIKNTDLVIDLDLNKKEFDSVSFSKFIQDKMVEGGSNITFVIGGSYGLSNKVKDRANYSISLSKMTFLHQMTRLILLEQIYRSFKIINNETYHK